METYAQIRARLGRDPWAKVKFYQPGTWLSRGGWKTVRGLERQLRSEVEYQAALKAQEQSIFFLEQVFPVAKLRDALMVVIE